MQPLSTLAARSLEPGQTMRITLRGTSMYPFFLDGDQLEVRREAGLKKGDIVVFDLQGVLVAHRILQVSETQITAGGDATTQFEKVSREEVAGKVLSRIRGSKKMEMNSLPAKLYTLFLPLSSLALRAYRKYFC